MGTDLALDIICRGGPVSQSANILLLLVGESHETVDGAGKLTLDKLFDNKLINDVISRIFVKTTKMTYPAQHHHRQISQLPQPLPSPQLLPYAGPPPLLSLSRGYPSSPRRTRTRVGKVGKNSPLQKKPLP